MCGYIRCVTQAERCVAISDVCDRLRDVLLYQMCVTQTERCVAISDVCDTG